jgi:gliding motility-associated-like protein
MKYLFTRVIFILLFLCSLNSIQLHAQQSANVNSALSTTPNYTTFTTPVKQVSEEATTNNIGYEQHPEIGMLFAEAPCRNCYELISKRTEISKTFIKAGTNGADIMQQTSSGPMHYKGPNGVWLTIKSRLQPGTQKGIFAAAEQEAPVEVNTVDKFASLGKAGQSIQFNRNLELVFSKPGGAEQVLGMADYSHYTAGNDGVYITNAWDGIDIEMHVVRGAIKTNFIINHSMPAYAGGSLHVRDHMHFSDGLSIFIPGESKQLHTGDMEIRKAGERLYTISTAVAFEKTAGRSTLQMLAYKVNGNNVDIVVPGNFLNRAASAYPVIIDPLVSFATTSAVSGSTYSPSWSTGCVYTNAATVPAKVTVTDIQFTFQYIASGGALTNNGAYDFRLSTCRSPAPASLYWNCSSGLPGTCDAIGATIFAGQIAPCLPGPSCTSYNMGLSMDFYQNYSSAGSCSPSYISAGTPLTITVFGHTVEANTITAMPSSVCQGQSTTLTATSSYGVPPYTYSWSPVASSSSTLSVSPLTTTTYTVTATDACGNSSTTTKTINVNPVSPINGTTTICAGGSSSLLCIPAGGTWSSSNPTVASVGASSGIVTGNALGTANITYTSTAGCTSVTMVNILVPVAPIIGNMSVCMGSTSSLSNATSGGVWSSSNTSVGTVGSSSGIATGLAAGTTTVSYTTSGAGCYTAAILTVNPLAPVTGTTNICVGGTTTLANTVAGGTWISGNTAVATIGATTGFASGVSAGMAMITYTTPAGCKATTSLVVNLLSPITGTTNVCQGTTTTLYDAASGGTWSSANPSVATIGSSTGIVTGIGGGTATITYTIPAGCFTTTNVTVNPISPISGVPSVCVGGTTTLSDAAGPGTWISSNPSIATIGGTSGIVTGMAVGNTSVTYTSSAGCTANTLVSVGLPTPITGPGSVCEGSTVTLSNSTIGGTWISTNTAVATISASSGILMGMSGGTVVISYTNPSGCSVTTTITVNANPAITGVFLLCVGGTTTLNSAVSGGSWNSASTGVATIGVSSGLVTAVSTGTSTIAYTTPAGCVNSGTLTVTIPTPISGATSVCQGSTTTLSNAAPGGTWSSSNPSVATIGASSGIVTGLAGGAITINYATSGGCNATILFTVDPVAPVTGMSTICVGTTLVLNNTVPGGSWSSLSPSVAIVVASTGVVTGMMGGTASIEYTTGAGCVSAGIVTVNSSPSPISGGTLVCTTTTLSNAVSGGTWSSSNPTIAVVNPSGLVTGILPGTVTITYTLPGGCFSTVLVTVDPLTGISGTPVVCQGNTTALSYPQPGGTWTSLNPSVATVDASGLVTGIVPGTAVVRYTTTTGCAASVNVTVHAQQPVTGATTVCQGNTITLSNAVAGGTWSSSSSSIASIGAGTGVATGVTAGLATMTYTTSAGCASTADITVKPLSPTTGSHMVCASSSTTLNNTTPGGGTWSSTMPAVATVGLGTGVVAGITAGVTTIRFSTSLGCIANFNVTVNPLPSTIGGIPKVCVGSTTVLTNSLPGGAWTSSAVAVATASAGSGIVSGITAGTTNITYTSPAGCTATIVVTVNPLPLSITGVTSICQGQIATLSDATPGGTWSSTVPSVATVAATGVVSGLLPGAAIIRYTTPEGCASTIPFIVNAVPATITGVMVVCEGATTTLYNTLAGGTWSSNNTAIATVGFTTGVVTGVTAGATTITYITSAGCYVTADVTVNPTPRITGTSFTNPTTCVNSDGTITLNGLVSGQSYTVNYSAGVAPVTLVLTANTSGNIVITGLSAGSYMNFSVTTTLGCTSNTFTGPIALTLPPAPPAPIVGTNSPVCDGVMLYLTATNSVPGVTYSWTGPGGFTSTAQNPIFNPGTLSHIGTYAVTATKLGCVSSPATVSVIVHPIPQISGFTVTHPSTCEGINGTVTLSGLLAGVSYSVSYTFNGNPVTATIVADGLGKVIITGLSKGLYADFNVSSFTCLSNSVGPVTLVDPSPPLPPAMFSNSPVCSGKTLSLDATNAITDLTYEWVGPNGFTSNQKDPKIQGVSMADSGLYTLTIRHLNCPTTKSMNVIVYPPLKLTNITEDKVIPLGSSVILKAEGAAVYYWAPNDGTLNNNNIDSPLATPQQTTVYTLRAMNVWGCEDTARIIIHVDDNILTDVPNAFTPNGDGKNDVFRVENTKYHQLVDFRVFNRWGQLIYLNTYNINEGWDGTFNGVPQDIGVYNYLIILSQPNGELKQLKGTVALIR